MRTELDAKLCWDDHAVMFVKTRCAEIPITAMAIIASVKAFIVLLPNLQFARNGHMHLQQVYQFRSPSSKN